MNPKVNTETEALETLMKMVKLIIKVKYKTMCFQMMIFYINFLKLKNEYIYL